MRRKIVERLTYANIMATLAVFLVLGGGTAFAVATIGSDDIQDNAVLSRHILDGQVRSNDILDGQVRPQDLSRPPAVRVSDFMADVPVHDDATLGLQCCFVTFETERIDQGGPVGSELHAEGSGLISIPRTGLYQLSASVDWRYPGDYDAETLHDVKLLTVTATRSGPTGCSRGGLVAYDRTEGGVSNDISDLISVRSGDLLNFCITQFHSAVPLSAEIRASVHYVGSAE